MFDTMIEWSGNSPSYPGAKSLDKIGRVFGADGKAEVNGSNVYDFWLAGEHDKIIEYNKQDVRDCRDLYRRMNFITEVAA